MWKLTFFIFLISSNAFSQKPKWLIEKENAWKKGFSAEKIKCFEEYEDLNKENNRDVITYNCQGKTGSGKGPCWKSYQKAEIKRQKCLSMK